MNVLRYMCELPAERGLEEPTWGLRPLQSALAGGHLSVVQYLSERSQQLGRPTARFALVYAAKLAWRRPRVASPENIAHARLARYLALSVPGSDGWLDSQQAAECTAEEQAHIAAGFGHPATSWLVTEVRARQLWRQRRCILLLRLLTQAQRASPASLGTRHLHAGTSVSGDDAAAAKVARGHSSEST